MADLKFNVINKSIRRKSSKRKVLMNIDSSINILNLLEESLIVEKANFPTTHNIVTKVKTPPLVFSKINVTEDNSFENNEILDTLNVIKANKISVLELFGGHIIVQRELEVAIQKTLKDWKKKKLLSGDYTSIRPAVLNIQEQIEELKYKNKSCWNKYCALKLKQLLADLRVELMGFKYAIATYTNIRLKLKRISIYNIFLKVIHNINQFACYPKNDVDGSNLIKFTLIKMSLLIKDPYKNEKIRERIYC
ncbi:MAG TPA: hypothetical protein VK202_06620 [Bacteroidia bacterium]|nr:hypothetical protein [Bacteroidia bacterium]